MITQSGFLLQIFKIILTYYGHRLSQDSYSERVFEHLKYLQGESIYLTSMVK